MLMGIVDGVPKLEVKMVLDKILQQDSVVMGVARGCILPDRIGVVVPVNGPGRKIRRMVLVPEIAKGGIGNEPGAIPVKKIRENQGLL